MGAGDGVANLNDMSIVCGKSELPWVLWYIVTSGKIGFTPTVGVEEVRKLSNTTALTAPWWSSRLGG